MKNINTKIWTLVLLLFTSWSVKAQTPNNIRAKIDSTNILLGDQIHLTYDIDQKEGTTFVFPNFTDTIMSKVEILDGPKMDTLQQDDKTILRATYLITSFDSGQYKIPRYPILLQKGNVTDTLLTPSVMLQVHSMKLKKQDGIVDIKKPYEAPITLEEVTPWILGFLLVISIFLIILYAIYRYKNKKPFFSGPIEPEEPYEIKAVRLLEELKQQYPNTKEEVKPFYVSLTDIVREYLSHRFGVSTLELTTDEIVDSLRNVKETKEYRQELRTLEEVLRLADMVKFAKYIPEESEHPRQLNICLAFVDKTKVVNEEKTDDDDQPHETATVVDTEINKETSTLSDEEENLLKYGPKNNQE
ncbi:hypothetical protein K5X82_01305 [Halosquirtibacter xylanolyticus]|uniref:hypothetical protein n=1 Tax=Halosquirtibacter xylanolyticus TaxID=3374599 RepID=UPI00374A48C3|nr:hypothetical protein K5X82_01305 [Prolixibacteraceae bacterium]